MKKLIILLAISITCQIFSSVDLKTTFDRALIIFAAASGRLATSAEGSNIFEKAIVDSNKAEAELRQICNIK